MYVKPQEIDQLTGAVNFSLERILALPQHGSTIHMITVLGGYQLGGTQKNIRTVFPAHVSPWQARRHRGLDGLVYMGFIACMEMPNRRRPLMRRMNRLQTSGTHFFRP